MKRIAVACARSFALAIAIAGCSLAFGIDKEDYARAPVTTVPDAATEANDANEGGSVEAATPDEGASVQSPCKSAHLFCDDFDDLNVTLSDRGWLPPFLTNGSTMVVDDLDSKSPTRSLSIKATPNGSSAMTHEVLPPSVPTDITVAFDIRVEEPGIGVAIADLALSAYHVRLVVLSTGIATLDEWDDGSGRLSARRASSSAIGGRWAHVEITLHFIANKQPGSRIVLRVDGNIAVEDSAAPSVPTADNIAFEIGDIDHPDSEVRARFDNVTIDTK